MTIVGCLVTVASCVHCKLGSDDDDNDIDFECGMTIGIGLILCLVVLPGLFNISWLIVGNVYVFGNWSEYNDGKGSCDFYMFSVALLIISWVAVPIFILVCCRLFRKCM